MQKKITLAPFRTELYMHKFCVANDAFDQDELKKIQEYCDQYLTENSYVIGHDGLPAKNRNVRVSDIKMHQPNEKNYWLFQKLLYISEETNNNFFNFELSGFEFFQYTEYTGAGSNYNWHIDMVYGENLPKSLQLTRKLSASLILSDPSEYKGGEFEIMTGGQEIEQIEQKPGSIIFFPSFMMHRVAPLTEGRRRSIVFWILGPKFK